jgi:hypothetical protein
MLDVDKLYEDFTKLLSEFDEEKIDTWLKFDEERELASQLSKGELKGFLLENPTPLKVNLTNMSAWDNVFAGDNYPLKIAA